MGALTLKSFPFELRGWDIEKFEGIDPTDGFGSSTRVYVSKDKVVQIEPDYDIFTYNTWITDKSRQFFDSMFGKWNSVPDPAKTNLNLIKSLKTIVIKSYISDHCNKIKEDSNYLTIVFENLSFESLSLLNILSEKYSFLKIRRAENIKTPNDLESNFQLNAASDKIKLNSSTLCLLIGTNTRYEGYYLNLNLRQRYRKGNFKCLVIGSLIDLTFPLSFLGSNVSVLKSIAEGNNLVCQEIKSAKNPLIILNSELFKRKDGKFLMEVAKKLNKSNVLSANWYGLNVLSPTLNETGTSSIANFKTINNKDLDNSNMLYLLNVATNNLSNLNKIVDSKLLNLATLPKTFLNVNKVIFDQNVKYNNNEELLGKLNKIDNNFINYNYMPESLFYETSRTYLNTEGIVKKSIKLIFNKKSKNSLQVLNRIGNLIKEKVLFLDQKNNNLLSYSSNKLLGFRNFINFNFYATNSLTNANFYLLSRNKPFIMLNNNRFKEKTYKLSNTKIKYWLDDFFSGGKDEYSHNSSVLSNCSKILRTESTNFF